MITMRQIAVCMALVIFAIGTTSAQHYYGGGHTIPLKIDSTKIMIKFDPMVFGDDMTNVIGSINRIVSVVTDDHAVDGFIACSLSTSSGYDSFLDSVQAMYQILGTEPFYLNSLDSAFLVGLRFCVAFDSALSSAQIDSINAANGAVIDHEVDGMPNVFVLLNTDSSGYRLLDLANRYYEMDETRYSHPEFGVWIEANVYQIYDEYASYQWHLKKVIGTFNVASVWDFAHL